MVHLIDRVYKFLLAFHYGFIFIIFEINRDIGRKSWLFHTLLAFDAPY